MALASALSLKETKIQIHMYRVTVVVTHLGWVDSDLGSSPGWWAASVATYCPSRMVNILILTQPNQVAHLTPQTVLHMYERILKIGFL